MNIVIIGASAAGLKAGCRARRISHNAKVTVLEKGKYISYSACGLPYFLSGDIDSFKELNTTAYDVVKDTDYFKKTKDIEVLTETEVKSINVAKKKVLCWRGGRVFELSFDKLLIATGAVPRKLNIAGSDLPYVCEFKTAEDAIELRKHLQTGEIEKVAIIGAGFIGCELCEAFTALWGVEVELFELLDYPLSKMLDREMSEIIIKELIKNEVGLHFGCNIESFEQEGETLRVCTKSGTYGGFDRVIIASGLTPATSLAAEAGIKIGSTGGIIVDEHMRTSVEDVYAAGDCVEIKNILTGKGCYLPLGSLANRMGRTAGNSIAGLNDIFEAVVGSSCVKIFDLNVAATGLTATEAKNAGFDPIETWGVFTDRAHFYPDSKLFSAKMVIDRKSKQILGIQVVGYGDVIRRIDSASNMIKHGYSLKRILNFEPAYAPPYANPLDPLHFLAYAGIAILEENIVSFNPIYIENEALNSIVIDVRENVEINELPFKYKTKKLINIPLTGLRNRLDEIPTNEKITVVCQRGTRSSEAIRILKENGWNEAKYMGGGLGFWLE